MYPFAIVCFIARTAAIVPTVRNFPRTRKKALRLTARIIIMTMAQKRGSLLGFTFSSE